MINNNMIDPNKIADLIKKTLKGSGYKVKMYTDEGDSTLDPRIARRFFTIPDKIMVTYNESDNLLKFHKSSSVSIDDIRDLHKSIKNLASKYNMDFVMREFGKEIEPKNYVSDSIKVINDKDDNASEIKEALSKLAGTHLKSNQTLDDSTKIIIKHSKSIDEEVKGSRSRHIDTIYVENSQGERFKYPYKNMSGARAMARHIHEGGTPYDNVGKAIISVSEDNIKLSKFLRYSRNNGLNEANQDTIDAVSKKVDSNKRFLHTLSNVNTYEATVNSIEDKIEEDKELDVANLKDSFTKRVFDENIEEVLPMVQKIIDEAGVAEAKKDPYAGMSMLDRAKNAELGPDISGEYSSKNIKKFADKKAEIVYKVTELNMRVMDDELNRVVTNAISKLEDGKNVAREDIDIIKALIARGKELGAYQESVKVDVVPEAEVAEWTEQVAGDKALFSEVAEEKDPEEQKALADELELLATNDGDLYRQQYMPIIKNLMRKRAKGKYDHDLAVKLWRYLIDNVAKKEAGPMARTKFPGMIRNLAAKSIADMEQDKMDNGEYDDVNLKIGASEAVEEGPVIVGEDSHTKSMDVKKAVDLAMDSIWDKEGENPKTVNVTKITINNPHAPGGYMDDEPDEGYRSVNVEHDGPWTIYTDSGFEKAISDMVGFEVSFTEQGMQEDGMASMEGDDPKMAKEAVDRDLALIRSRAGV